MIHPTGDTKADKKAGKAEAKREKKLAKAQMVSTPTPATDSPAASSPGERSAAAAERQVKLQQYRVWLALAMVFVGLTTLFFTIQPWKKDANNAKTGDVPSATQPVSP